MILTTLIAIGEILAIAAVVVMVLGLWGLMELNYVLQRRFPRYARWLHRIWNWGRK